METNDLILRNWQENDVLNLYEMSLDPDFKKSGIPDFDSVEDCRHVIRHWSKEPGCKAIVEKETHSFVGFISLSDMNRYDTYMELEYAIAAQYRNRGYAKQAVRRMTAYGFTDLHLSAIAAWVRSHNVRSVRVLEKCAFTFEGRLRKHARD
ncbi:MAG: GNAT family N-acetyltransferase, partial [Lachnospiraceae bacterium]|nr:GNAT family N-acetyltransferase [Lachnospiraceae bacterium]